MGEAKMGLMLKETLKNLCFSNGWSYAVFWRFDQRNSMLLTMEDAYYEEQMGTLVNDMRLQVHVLGEGIVGQVASRGHHRWIFSDAANGGWDSTNSVGDQDDCAMRRQFSYGIKTIAVISVELQGVIQFGSSQKILKRLEFFDEIRRLFGEMGNVWLTSLLNQPSSLNCESYDLNEWFSTFCNGSSSCNEPMEMAYSSMNLTQLSSLTSDFQGDSTFDSIYSIEGLSGVGKPVGANSGTLVSNQQSALPMRAAEGELPENQTSLLQIPQEFKPLDFTTELSNSCLVDNLLEWFAPPPEFNISEMAPVMNEQPSNSVHSSITETYACGGRQKPVIVSCAQNDPFKGLGQEFGCGQARDQWQSVMMPAVHSSQLANTTAVSELDVGSLIAPRKGLFAESGLNELLEGISYSNFVGNSSNDVQFSAKRRKVESSSVNGNQVQLASVSCSSSSTSLQPTYNSERTNNFVSKKEGFPKSQVGLWIDDSYSINNNGSNIQANLKNREEPTKTTRKRARPGESTRPRPKDRQQIQDRLKELKGIIPGGEKCSIDALLDRTIKHMLFLQSMTKYAEKLKRANEPKPIGQEKEMVRKDNNASSSGATWALEVGDQTAVCPIIIEDIDPPGLMLIEMICEDRGFFLEIADVLRGFGLTIMKGMMELREDKIWARFIVEAEAHVTRIDIFWFLVEFMQRTRSSGMDSTNQPSNITNHGIPLLNNHHQPALPRAISLAETLQ